MHHIEKDERDLRGVVLATYIFAGFMGLCVAGSVLQLVAGTFGLFGFSGGAPWFVAGLFGIITGTLLAMANVKSARAISAREDEHFSFFMAGLNCMMFPLGTILSIYTWNVLARPSVRALYGNPLLTTSNAKEPNSGQPKEVPVLKATKQKKQPELVVAPEMSFHEAMAHVEDQEDEVWRKFEEDVKRGQSGTTSDS